MLPTRRIGPIVTSALGLGCMGMTRSYGTEEERDEKESIATIHRALDLGVTMFDTAEVYGPFTNEELLAKALGRRRQDVLIATKFGWLIRDGRSVGVDSHPASIRRAVEGSLRRLRTDYIDLLYQHRIDPAIPIEDVVGTMGDLVQEGKARFLGLSEAGVTNIRKAHAVHPIAALQSEYSLWERNLEDEIIPLLRELGIGLVPFSPLGRGFLTGTAKPATEYVEDDFRREDPRYQPGNFEVNVRAAAAVEGMAKEKGATPAQIALAWILNKAEDFVPIPGTKRTKYLEENLAATDIVLDPSDMQRLEEALAPDRVAGERYSEKKMKMIDR